MPGFFICCLYHFCKLVVMSEDSMIKKILMPVKKFCRFLPDILYGISFTCVFLFMCWYLYGVCDLAYVNF